jgi:peptidoglycan/LPS O-acetylase OafA/YrhL
LELLAAHPTDVSLSASTGRLDKPTLLVPANSARESALLRSAWLGEATLVAKTDSFTTDPTRITFTTPWSYLVAIVLGALLGAYVSVRLNGKGVQSPEFLAGAGIGLILAVGSFVGITTLVQLPAAAIVTEAGCFVIAAIEAYAGRATLDRLTKPSAPKSADATS